MSHVQQFLASPLGSALKIFLAVMLTVSVTDWANQGCISFVRWQTWVIAGLVSAVPVAVNWLNPADCRYGAGSHSNAREELVDHDG